MTRRNLLRSWLAATLMTASGAAGVLAVSQTPAGAAEFEVSVSEQGFAPSDATVAPNTLIVFRLAAGATTRHTITTDRFDLPFDQKQCYKGPRTLCIPVGRVGFEYYDRYAREAGVDHRGVIRVVGQPTTPPSTQPPPPTTTSTTAPAPTTTTRPPAPTTTSRPPAPTTTTTQPATTSTQPAPPPTTTATTAPSSIRPFLVDSGPTTTAPPVNPAGSGGNGAGATTSTADKDKDKGKNKGKGVEVDSPATPTTAAPAPPEAPLIDPASLVPGPVTLPDSEPDPDDMNFDLAALTDLLNPQPADEDGTDPALMLIALGGGLACLLAGGVWRWYHRASRYDPA